MKTQKNAITMMKQPKVKPTNNALEILPEPLIEFRYSQAVADPHDGLNLFGPYDSDLPSKPKSMIVGLVGTEAGIQLYNDWSEEVMCRPHSVTEDNTRLWPPFPGFDVAFQSSWSRRPASVDCIDEDNLIHQAHNLDPNLRTARVVDTYLSSISKFKERDDPFNVIVCVIPDEIWKTCRVKSHVEYGGWGRPLTRKIRDMRAGGQQSILEDDDWDQADYAYSLDFRRQLKAKCMKYDIPIQLIRESTFTLTQGHDTPKRGLTPVSDRAWNLGTAIYYKAGGKPWKLSTAREGVCYIGLSFKKAEPRKKSKTACCAAQMFLDSGDGIVFMGDKGPWYSPDDHQFHLTKDAARRLLEGVLSTYDRLEGRELSEVFLHSRSEISREEFEGYSAACPSGVKLVGVRVRPDDGLKVYRLGKLPVLRGTLWTLNNQTAFLFAHGYKWRIQTYDGFYVPKPLRIDIMHGEGSIRQVAQDILGLTKLNYNACRLGSSKPVTIDFSDAVGEILVHNPPIKDRSSKFKFYI